MKRLRVWLFSLSCLLGAPLFAQTQIGGGTCNSSSLSGTYAFTITGRQVNSSGAFTSVFEANGSATFDGQSKVTLTTIAATVLSVATPITYSGAYSIQANCGGAISITTGDTATFNLVVYNQGNAFLVTGSDATYTFTGSGNTQPATCSTAMLAGVYTFNATGFGLSGGAVAGASDAAGLLQFDGVSNVTANFSTSSTGSAPSAVVLTGSYSVTSACAGTATLTDSKGNSYTMSLSISGASAVAVNAFFVMLGQPSKLIVTGTGHSAYGQPAASSLNLRFNLPFSIDAEERRA